MARIVSLLVTLLLAGCSQANWNEQLSTPQQRHLAIQFIDSFRQGSLEQMSKDIDQQILPELSKQSKELASQIPEGVPQLVTVSSNTRNHGSGSQTLTALNYEIGKAGRWAVFQVTLSDASGRQLVAGWRMAPAVQQPTRSGDFAAGKAGGLGYLWLALMVCSIVTCLAGALVSFRDKLLPNRVLWIIGSLFGLVTFSLNWATGATAFTPISFQLLGASAFRPSPFDGWTVAFAIPVVAIIVLVRFFQNRLVTTSSEQT